MRLPALFYILGAPLAFSPDARTDLVPTGPLLLNPNGDTTKCLDVRGGVFANGTPVQMYVSIATPVRMPFSDSSLFSGIFVLVTASIVTTLLRRNGPSRRGIPKFRCLARTFVLMRVRVSGELNTIREVS